MKASGVVESVLSTQEKRDGIYAGFDKAIAALKSSKDSNAFQASVSKLTEITSCCSFKDNTFAF
jgi:hypothetical protein